MKRSMHAFLNKVLRTFNLRLIRLSRRPDIDSHSGLDLFHMYGKALCQGSDSPVNLIQVGANDGVSEDSVAPLMHYSHLTAVLIEPNPLVFERLQSNKSELKNVRTVNCAISDEGGYLTMYFPRVPEGASNRDPKGVSKVASTHRAHVEAYVKRANSASEMKIQIEEARVPCRTLTDIMREHKMNDLDILYVDTEGHDLVILESGFKAGLKPKLLQFEYRNLSRIDFARSLALLDAEGYVYARSGKDILAVRSDVVKML